MHLASSQLFFHRNDLHYVELHAWASANPQISKCTALADPPPIFSPKLRNPDT